MHDSDNGLNEPHINLSKRIATSGLMVDDKQQITAVLAATLVEEVSLYIPAHISMQDTNMPPYISSNSQDNGT